MKKILLLVFGVLLLSACSLGNREVKEEQLYSCIPSVRINEEKQVNEIILTCPEGEELIASGGVLDILKMTDADFHLFNPISHFDRFVTFEKSGFGMRLLSLYSRESKATVSFIEAELYGFTKETNAFYACSNSLVTMSNYCRVYSTDNLSRPAIVREKFINSFSIDEDENLVIKYLRPGIEELEVEKIDLKIIQ